MRLHIKPGLKFGLFSYIFLLVCSAVCAQLRPAPDFQKNTPVIHHHSVLEETIIPESDCSNGLDDDNNGLTDMKDFHCYFSNQANMEECGSSKIVWASSNWGLHWFDLETNEQKLFYIRDAF